MKGTKHIHGPYTHHHLSEIIIDLLTCPEEWKSSCPQGITVFRFYTSKSEKNKMKAMMKI